MTHPGGSRIPKCFSCMGLWRLHLASDGYGACSGLTRCIPDASSETASRRHRYTERPRKAGIWRDFDGHQSRRVLRSRVGGRCRERRGLFRDSRQDGPGSSRGSHGRYRSTCAGRRHRNGGHPGGPRADRAAAGCGGSASTSRRVPACTGEGTSRAGARARCASHGVAYDVSRTSARPGAHARAASDGSTNRRQRERVRRSGAGRHSSSGGSPHRGASEAVR